MSVTINSENKTTRWRTVDNKTAFGENTDARKDEKDKLFEEMQKQIYVIMEKEI